jgi:ABC-type Na+ efflux pump permease subunit
MSKPTKESLRDSLNIIWTIASKDIVDALKNRVVVSMIIMLSIVLLVPKMLPLIFEQSQTVLPIYDPGDSSLVAELKKAPDISVQKLRSEQELRAALCG